MTAVVEERGAERLIDWPPAGFIQHVLSKHPAPVREWVDPETGEFKREALWERGIRLQGHQARCIEGAERFIQAAGGIRGGKSFIGALRIYVDYMWRRAHRGIRTDLWGIIADSYEMAKEEMRHLSKLLNDSGVPHDMRTPHAQSWSITFPDSDCEVVTLTASDVTKIASRPYRGIVIAEAAQTVREAMENAFGRVSETRGWVFLEGTFENAKGPWYAMLYEEWQRPDSFGVSISLPSWENLVVYPGGREDPEILAAERRHSPAFFMEKYGGVPVKRSDLAIPYADDRFHVKHRYPALGTSYDPQQPVYLFSDPGTAHAYAVFAVQFASTRGVDPLSGRSGFSWADDPRQTRRNIAWIIDAVYRWDRTAEQVIEECASREWAPAVTQAVMDFASRQRRAEGPPIIEQWSVLWRRHTGKRLYVTAEPVPLQAGYDIHKRALLNSWPEEDAERQFNHDKKMRVVVDPTGPRLMVDPRASAPLFGGFVDDRQYAGEYNLHRKRKNREGTIVSDDYIDADNDAIKALNYGLYWYFGASGFKPQVPLGSAVPWEMTVR